MSSNTIEVQFKPKYPKAKKMVPLILTLLVIIFDQLTKFLIVKNIPINTIGAQFFGDFIRIIHVSNPGIAFSIGHGWSLAAKAVLFRAVPLVVKSVKCQERVKSEARKKRCVNSPRQKRKPPCSVRVRNKKNNRAVKINRKARKSENIKDFL